MINESITFDKLPQAVSYLTQQVIEVTTQHPYGHE